MNLFKDIWRDWHNLPKKRWPRWLELIYRIWMIPAIILGNIVSRLILVIIFYLIFTPLSILLKIFRDKDLLQEHWDFSRPSYWYKIEEDSHGTDSYGRQF
ncbi:MAG: hypothetical protein AAB371_02705 [Patescibacteria group bacterium]